MIKGIQTSLYFMSALQLYQFEDTRVVKCLFINFSTLCIYNSIVYVLELLSSTAELANDLLWKQGALFLSLPLCFSVSLSLCLSVSLSLCLSVFLSVYKH